MTIILRALRQGHDTVVRMPGHGLERMIRGIVVTGLAQDFRQFDLADLPALNMVFTQPIEMRLNEMIAGIRTDVGVKVFGDDLDVLRETGYRYSSSIYPIRHDLYGMPDAPRFAFRPGDEDFVEFPVTTVRA